jgi:hypothetical protein
MKKIGFLCVSLALAVFASAAFAGADDVQLGGSVKNTSALTNSYFVRGDIAGIFITTPTNMTCTVSVASSEGTIFSKTVTGGASAATTYYSLRFPAYDSAGNVLNTNVLMVPLTVASKVTATLTGVLPASATNAVVVQLNVNK